MGGGFGGRGVRSARQKRGGGGHSFFSCELPSRRLSLPHRGAGAAAATAWVIVACGRGARRRVGREGRSMVAQGGRARNERSARKTFDPPRGGLPLFTLPIQLPPTHKNPRAPHPPASKPSHAVPGLLYPARPGLHLPTGRPGLPPLPPRGGAPPGRVGAPAQGDSRGAQRAQQVVRRQTRGHVRAPPGAHAHIHALRDRVGVGMRAVPAPRAEPFGVCARARMRKPKN